VLITCLLKTSYGFNSNDQQLELALVSGTDGVIRRRKAELLVFCCHTGKKEEYPQQQEIISRVEIIRPQVIKEYATHKNSNYTKQHHNYANGSAYPCKQFQPVFHTNEFICSDYFFNSTVVSRKVPYTYVNRRFRNPCKYNTFSNLRKRVCCKQVYFKRNESIFNIFSILHYEITGTRFIITFHVMRDDESLFSVSLNAIPVIYEKVVYQGY
jgi:hypothetical protein